MQRTSVDLPEPDGPHRTIFSPARTDRLMPDRAWKLPNHLSTPCMTIMGWTVPGVAGLPVWLVMSVSTSVACYQPATNETPSMLSGKDDGSGNFIHFIWIFANSPLALIWSMKVLSEALISFSPSRVQAPL